jgi:hypothetical protein
VPRTSRQVASGLPTPPSLSDCHWSSLRAAVMRWPIAPQRAATVSCAMQPQCPELIAMRQPVQHGPPASSRHHRPAATTSLRVHAMQRLLLPLGAKRLKPGVSRQSTSRAHPAALSSPHQASAAACPDALSRVRVRYPPLRPTPHATASARSSTSGKSAALRALHTQLALPLLATVLAGTPTLLRACKRPPRLCAGVHGSALLRQALPSST